MEKMISSQELQVIRKTLSTEKGLTEREIHIFFVIGTGVSNLEASKKLRIEEGTVKFHLTSIFKKLGIKKRSKIVLLAHGLKKISE